MDLTKLIDSLQSTLGQNLPSILGALGILIVGWLVAVILRAGVRRGLGAIKLNARLKESARLDINLEAYIAITLFWLIILITLVGVFNSINLELVSAPFNAFVTQILGYLPRLIGGGLLALVAWVIAVLVRVVVAKILGLTKLDERLSAEAGMRPMSEYVGDVLFWLILLLFIPPVVGTLELQGLLGPFEAMVNKILGALPNIFAAVLLGIIGWLLARVLRNLVANLLAAGGTDKLGQNAGLKGTMSLSRIIANVVFILVIVPVLIAALDALQMKSISQPATDMLGAIMRAVPNIIAAAVILTLTYFVARFVARLLADLASGVGIDALPRKLGMPKAFSGKYRLSHLIGDLILFFAMLFATVEASSRLDFTEVRDLVATFIKFGGQVLLGSVILAVGLWLANLAYDGIRRVSGDESRGLARIAQIAVLGVITAMGLRAMGIADEIVELAFGLILGAAAVAVALSFGLGGREAAGKQMEYWLSKLRKERKLLSDDK
jgi:hypothetical protein